jgi:hypothetical protein
MAGWRAPRRTSQSNTSSAISNGGGCLKGGYRDRCTAGPTAHPLAVLPDLPVAIAERRLTAVPAKRLSEEPAVVLNGPRTVGKSTLLRRLGDHLGRPVIDCDDPAPKVHLVDSGVAEDPNATVIRPSPVPLTAVVSELWDPRLAWGRWGVPGFGVVAGAGRCTAVG